MDITNELQEINLSLNDVDFVLEIDRGMDDVLHTSLSFLLTEAFESIESYDFIITESIHGDFILKNKNNKRIVLFYRDKEGGGRAGNVSKHSNTVKIIYPKDLQNITIIIPTDKDSKAEVDGNPTRSQIQKAKPAIDFVNNNARYLNAIFNSKQDETKRRAVKQIVTHNADVLDDITFNDDNSPNDKYADKLREKLERLKNE